MARYAHRAQRCGAPARGHNGNTPIVSVQPTHKLTHYPNTYVRLFLFMRISRILAGLVLLRESKR